VNTGLEGKEMKGKWLSLERLCPSVICMTWALKVGLGPLITSKMEEITSESDSIEWLLAPIG
jgi:hypothetical protein